MLAFGLVLLIWLGALPLCFGYMGWIYPSSGDEDLSFNYKDVVYFTWASDVKDLYMNLWCAPSPDKPQSRASLYHAFMPDNGSNPQSFDYPDYSQGGICHMQVKNSQGDQSQNTPTFNLHSDDNSKPKTWGIAALGDTGGTPYPSEIQVLTSIPSSILLAVTAPTTSSSSIDLSSTSTSAPASTASVSPTTSSTLPSGTLLFSSNPRPSAGTTDEASLTPAAKAGISLGAVVSFLAICLFLLFAHWWWSRRRQRLETLPRTSDTNSSGHLNDPKKPHNGNQLVGSYEMDAQVMPLDLNGRPRAELPARNIPLNR